MLKKNTFLFSFFLFFLIIISFSCKTEVQSPKSGSEDESTGANKTENDLPVPQNVEATYYQWNLNNVNVSWDKIDDISYYNVYYSTQNDISTAKLYIKNKNVTEPKYSYQLVVLEETGTYYFWIQSVSGEEEDSEKSDFSEPAIYEFEFEELVPPSDFEVFEGNYSNTVAFEYTRTKARSEKIYYSLTNDFSTAKVLAKNYIKNNNYVLSVSGTYYFWITSKNSSSDDSKEGDPSGSISYEFTFIPTYDSSLKITSYDKPFPPNIRLYFNSTSGSNVYRWIYMSKENDTSKLIEPNYFSNGSSNYVDTNDFNEMDIEGTYYFWVREATDEPGHYVTSEVTISDFSDPYTIAF